MRYRVAIRRNSDQRVHVSRWQEFNGDLRGLEYWWNEGNGACDCNRHDEFERAADPDSNDRGYDFDCGDTAYSIVRFDIDRAFGEKHEP